MTNLNGNDIFLQAMVRGILTNEVTPVACVNRIFDLKLNSQEEQAMVTKLTNLLKGKNITMAGLFNRAYDDAKKRKELLS